MTLRSPLAPSSRHQGARRAYPATVVAIGALLLAGCSPGTSAGTSATLSVGTTTYAPATAPQVPRVTGTLLDGAKLRLAAYRGHVVVLNFWGSWCTVCREEAPVLSAAAKRFHAANVRFIGVDIEDNTASADAYMRHFGINYPSLADPADKIALNFSQVVPTTAFPSTLIISPGQRITGRIIGAVSSRALAQLIERAEKQTK